jgi:type II secretory pathway pseudopilin PulG
MQCPHCAADVAEGLRFCPACRKRVVAPTAGFDQAPPRPAVPRAPTGDPAAAAARPVPPLEIAPPPRQLAVGAALAFGGTLAEIRRPGAVTALAVWNLLQGALLLLVGLAVLFTAFAGADAGAAETVWMAALCLLYVAMGAAHVAAGVGLLGMRSWARILQIVLASIGLLGIPCGTVISIFILVYMMKPGVRILFSGKTGELTPEEATAVSGALQSSGVIWVIGGLVILMVVVAMIGIIAAIAIPSLLRARVSANEAAAIGNLRSLVSAEAAVASANGGRYTTPECLHQPEACIPDWPAGTRPLSGEIVFDAPARGYVLRFHPGPAAVAEGQADAAPFHLTGYAITAVPASVQAGIRRFCADDSGLIFVMPEGAVPTDDGRCPESSEPLR